ncbi:hypothetical protein GY45DRAFT_1238580 [Cubamyces sp. BRFM 1775]|nr:hypothetical protein GY45DRAFT_1238580 [Cubamyces sp. BRFM 1775]
MSAIASRFRLTFLFVLLASSLVLAHSGSHNHNGRRHAAVNFFNDTLKIEKRFDNTRFTFFFVGQNACGGFDHDSDFIVALNTHQWDGGSHCYEDITVEYQGKSTNAKITDECEECPYGAIDLSPSLFSYLAGSTDPGQIYGGWNYGGGAAPSQTTTPEKPTHTTHQQPTSTPSPTPTPTPSPTSHKSSTHKSSTHTTQTSASTSSVATSTTPTSTSTSTSATPTTTVLSWDNGNIDSFNLAMVQLVNLQNAIYAAGGVSA